MATVILFITYILISMMFTWKYVDFIKRKQWDIKSARILLAIFISIIGLLLLAIRVSMLGGIEDGEQKIISLTLILGTFIILIIVILSIWVMHLVRKMKYMQVTFAIPINDPSRGSLSEANMTCLVDRDQVLNVQKVFNTTIIPGDVTKEEPVKEPTKKEDVKEKKSYEVVNTTKRTR